MRAKIFFCLVLILVGLGCYAEASMVVIPVDSTNIQSQPFVVRADTSGNASDDKSINFYVVADPKGPPYPPGDNMHFALGGANLSIYDGTNLVSAASVAGGKVPSFMRDLTTTNGVFYSFEVGTNHLDSAQFEICYGSEIHPAVDCYRFALRTFVPESSLGLLLGTRDGKIEITEVQPNTPAARAGLTPGLLVQQINGTDSAHYGLKLAQDAFRFGIVELELVDPSNGKTNRVRLTTARTFPSAIH
jgi:hypothetical protein